METVITALTTAITSFAGNAMDVIGDVIPVALPIMGAIIVVNIGMGIFKRFTHA